MPLFRGSERPFAEALRALAHENPFTPGRFARERAALGSDFSDAGTAWAAEDDELPAPGAPERPNLVLLRARSHKLADECRRRLASARAVSPADLELYEDVVLYALFAAHESSFYALALDLGPTSDRPRFYRDFERDFDRWFKVDGTAFPSALTPEFVFSVFFQIRRAFHYIFREIFGGSTAAVKLRSAVWESVFTRDLRRYRQGLYGRMHDIPTLIVGESGTGKELVARAIARSRFVPFDREKQRFAVSFGPRYFALSLSALSPTLIESELFGHRRGAFTGALEDREGWLEACGEHGTVFLDEIGDLDPVIQVKLLRVLQDREFVRIGETSPRRFLGKIVAATNREFASEVAEGRFREDLYYRLCADVVVAPTLRERIASDREELGRLVRVIARRIAGDAAGTALAHDVLAFVDARMDRGYPWPGNVRELEQCVRSVLVRGEYEPLAAPRGASEAALDRALDSSGLDAEGVLRRYCTLVYAKTRNFVETGKRLGLDRRTVKDHVDPVLLRRFGVTITEG